MLPRRLEDFELADQAQSLLKIPRVIAVEPRRSRAIWRVSDLAATRQARRLRFPGRPRVVVLYHPAQYLLARGLTTRYRESELWYIRAPDPNRVIAESDELSELDRLARERAVESHHLIVSAEAPDAERRLRRRFQELEIISHRPFVPGARVEHG